MHTADVANNGGGAGTNGPPTKPTKKAIWMTAQDAAAESRRHHENVLVALRRGLLIGSQSGPKASWSIERADFDDWMRRGAPIARAA